MAVILDILCIKAWCSYHRCRTWHILRIDGVLVCLECRLEGNETIPMLLCPGVSGVRDS
jgi:hypothetical protein